MSVSSKTLAGDSLPLPVVQSTTTNESQRKPRFSPSNPRNQLRVRWAKLKRRIGSGSAPDDHNDLTTATSDASENGSSFAGGRRQAPVGGGEEPTDEVDEVVVDQTMAFGDWGAKNSTSQGGRLSAREDGFGTGGTGTKGDGSEGSMTGRGTGWVSEQGVGQIGAWLRWRVWPLTRYFFAPSYHDLPTEDAYQKEIWYTQKSTYIFGACFLVLNWVWGVSLLPHPWSRWNKIYYYLIGPITTVPLVPMAILDFPRRTFWAWQLLLLISIYLCAAANIVDMNLCNYYVPAHKSCGNRDFQATLYYASALPVVGLFALGLSRTFASIGAVLWILLVGGAILPIRVAYIRNVINIVMFQSFVIYTHYRRDLADRRMYTMRSELKVQFKAKQKAQINERKTMDSKRRFSSYIFHEVRVPLNTALLAVQNLEGANVFDKSSEHAEEYAALKGSLEMMSGVLNDVLDFSRMERGGFTSVSRPFSFHNVMRSIFVPLRLDANARGLDLITALDVRVDEVAVRAAFPEEAGDNDPVNEGDGTVMGDEMRLRQVINNLASNACKFTSAGGQISITTRMIYPLDSCPSGIDGTTAYESAISDVTTAGSYSPRLSANRLQQHEAKDDDRSHDLIVVRIEITDTGVGIRPKDMTDSKLFSAYVQTEIGRHQGGKGTGLGLSLVRQIVMLSGGRLGVKSRVGFGSTFWVEMPFGVGPQTRRTDFQDAGRRIGNSMTPGSESSVGSATRESKKLLATSDYELDDSGITVIGDEKGGIELGPIGAFRLSSPPRQDKTSTNDRLVRPDAHTTMSSVSAPAAVAPAADQTLKAKNAKLEFADGPLRVLIVDDDNLTRRLMGRMMERLGCTISSAENGQIALDMLLQVTDPPPASPTTGIDPRSGSAKKNYDITFLDNQMPICSGLEVVSMLRSLGRDDLVIGVTANALLSDQEQYLEQGASFVLTKPVLEEQLRRYLIIADQRRKDAKAGIVGQVVRPPPIIIRSDS